MLPTDWVATATQGLSLVNVTAIGDLAGSTPLHIAVALKLADPAGLQQYIRNINDPTNAQYGASLTPDQFVGAFALSQAAVSNVMDYLTSQGFTNVQAEPNNLFVTADGTAAQASAAFNTHLGQFTQFGRTVFANTTAAEVPASLGNSVLAVLGLNNAGRFSTGPSLPSLPYPKTYGPRISGRLMTWARLPPAQKRTLPSSPKAI